MAPPFLAPFVALTGLGGLILAAETVPNDPVSWLQTGGTAALIGGLVYAVLAFIKGWVVSGKSHQAELDVRDKRISALEMEVREQNLVLRDQVMPVMTRVQDVVAKMLDEQTWKERLQRERQP